MKPSHNVRWFFVIYTGSLYNELRAFMLHICGMEVMHVV